MRELPLGRTYVALPDRRTAVLRRSLRIYPPNPPIAAAQYKDAIVVVCTRGLVAIYDPESLALRSQTIHQQHIAEAQFSDGKVLLHFEDGDELALEPTAF